MSLFRFKSKGKLRQLVDLVYPVGSIYISTASTNPGTLFGGTWEAFAPGRVLIGAGQGDDGTTSMSFTSEAKGGNYLIKLLESQLPQHTHTGMGGPLMIAGAGDRAQIASGTNATYGTTNGGENCNNDAINIQNPYIVVNMWKRVS